MDIPITDSFVFLNRYIVIILNIAPDNEKKKLIPKPVLSKATIKTLTNDTVIAVLKLYSYKVNIITILARPNFISYKGEITFYYWYYYTYWG